MRRALIEYQVLAFDCYGTLIDWESGIWDAFQPALRSTSRDDVTRTVVLELFAEIESACQAETPERFYPDLLAEVHRRMMDRFDLSSSEAQHRAFGASVPYWPAFPDSADALRVLKRHYKLVILSNVDRAGFATSNARLGVDFDAIYTAEDIGSYKPNPANFSYLIERLERDFTVDAGGVLHTAQSLFHDLAPAGVAGLDTAWIDRQGLERSENWGATAKLAERPRVDYVFSTLGAMVAAVLRG